MNNKQIYLKMNRDELYILINYINISDYHNKILNCGNSSYLLNGHVIDYNEYYKTVKNVISRINNLLSNTSSKYCLNISEYEFQIIQFSIGKRFIREINDLKETIDILKCNIIISNNNEILDFISKIAPIIEDLSNIENLYNLFKKEEIK